MALSKYEVHKKTKDEKVMLELANNDELSRWEEGRAFGELGQKRRRPEGPEKVSGRARYTCDVRLPNQLYAAVLRSPHPHARILEVDTSVAETLPGVHGVLSLNDVPDIPWYGEKVPILGNIVRFVGDEVAVVAAESEEVAEDALRLIRVAYDPLPFVTDLERALEEGAPKVHEGGNLMAEPEVYERGDADRGLSEADVVIDESYTTQTALHNALEPHGATVAWQGDELLIFESTQGIFDVRERVADVLGLKEAQVRVIKEHMGGGFGAKQVAWKQTVLAAILSLRLGRPVQLMLDREAENLAAGNRNATRQHLKLSAKRDGTLTAIVLDALIAAGAYSVGGEGSDVASLYQHMYACKNVRTVQRQVYVNAGPAVAFRAPGYAEAAFALESAMDALAEELGMDPFELRLKNYTERDQKQDKPYSSPQGLRRCYERAAEAFGWKDYQKPSLKGNKRRGVGMAASEWMGGNGNPPAYAWVKLGGDGSVEVVTGSQDIGTGTRTMLAQVAAEVLGVPLEVMTIRLGDTAAGPYAPTSSGSATAPTLGPAVRAAAEDAREQLLSAAGELLGCDARDLTLEKGELRAKNGKRISVVEVTSALSPHMIQGHGARNANSDETSIRTFSAQCAEVEVDLDTGDVTLLRVVCAPDCGRILSPVMVDSQVIGGVTQGVGYALTEERVVDDGLGVVLNANLEDYLVPTMMDVPPIQHAEVNLPDLNANPIGAKGIGEPPIIPTAPAIANAIFDATGVRVCDLPLSRRRLVTALSARGEA